MLICLVTLEMKSPDGITRRWRGLPRDKDWELLLAQKKRDGWKLIRHDREFVERNDLEEVTDKVELANA